MRDSMLKFKIICVTLCMVFAQAADTNRVNRDEFIKGKRKFFGEDDPVVNFDDQLSKKILDVAAINLIQSILDDKNQIAQYVKCHGNDILFHTMPVGQFTPISPIAAVKISNNSQALDSLSEFVDKNTIEAEAIKKQIDFYMK